MRRQGPARPRGRQGQAGLSREDGTDLAKLKADATFLEIEAQKAQAIQGRAAIDQQRLWLESQAWVSPRSSHRTASSRIPTGSPSPSSPSRTLSRDPRPPAGITPEPRASRYRSGKTGRSSGKRDRSCGADGRTDKVGLRVAGDETRWAAARCTLGRDLAGLTAARPRVVALDLRPVRGDRPAVAAHVARDDADAAGAGPLAFEGGSALRSVRHPRRHALGPPRPGEFLEPAGPQRPPWPRPATPRPPRRSGTRASRRRPAAGRPPRTSARRPGGRASPPASRRAAPGVDDREVVVSPDALPIALHFVDDAAHGHSSTAVRGRPVLPRGGRGRGRAGEIPGGTLSRPGRRIPSGWRGMCMRFWNDWERGLASGGSGCRACPGMPDAPRRPSPVQAWWPSHSLLLGRARQGRGRRTCRRRCTGATWSK